MFVKTEAIVLHTLKYGETRMIVELFTRHLGRIAVALTIPKTAKGKLKKQYFQPMTLLEVTADVRQKVQLQKLTDARLLVPYLTIPVQPEKLAIALFVAEFLYYALRSEQRDEQLYDYIADSLQWLDTAQEGYANFHLTFLLRLSRFLGFFPNLEGRGEYFDLREGTFCETVPTHGDCLAPEEARLMRLLMRMDFPTMHLFRLSRHDRQQVMEVLMRYYKLHLPDFPEMKSLAVLHQLWT